MVSKQRYQFDKKMFACTLLVLAILFVLLSCFCSLLSSGIPDILLKNLPYAADADTALLDKVNGTLGQEVMFEDVRDTLRSLQSTLGFVLFGLSAAGLAACFVAEVPAAQPTPVITRVRLDN